MEANGAEVPQRTSEEISSILAHAKLKQEDFLGTTQVLYINGTNAKSDNYKLLELDSHLLETLKCNNTIAFKGSDEDFAVLCTDTRTYDVRECETSNSLLLIPDLEFSSELKSSECDSVKGKYVYGINYKYLEVYPIKPQLKNIGKMLEGTKYKGPEQEYLYQDLRLMDFEEFVDVAQASRRELQELLKKMDAMVIGGKIRIVDLEYHFRVLSYLLKSIEENSWPLDEIRKEESVNAWSEVVPVEVLEAIFNMYAEESKEIDGEMRYKYDERRICQFFARVLLQYAGKFNLNDFLQAWKESVPEGMTVEEDMLQGIAIVDRNARPAVIWVFPENNLPDNIVERFEILFKTKPKWTVGEIAPYIQSLTTDKLDANALLAKYARASTVKGVRYYSAKHDN